MLLTPRYGTEPIVELDGDPSAIAVPAIRQRRRLGRALANLTDDEWNHPSRCAGWSSRDVVAHLDGTNGFWEFATQSALAGQPTEMLASFDPVASPAAMVDAHATAPADLLISFTASTDRLVQLWKSIGSDGWTALGEAPPGHMSLSAVTHHALWDSWIHERDILLPLGIEVDEEADEIERCLRYATALGPALGVSRGRDRRGRFCIAATAPDIDITIDIDGAVRVSDGRSIDAFVLSGGAVELLEAFSFREPLGQTVPSEHTWMFDGLAEVFETDAW